MILAIIKNEISKRFHRMGTNFFYNMNVQRLIYRSERKCFMLKEPGKKKKWIVPTLLIIAGIGIFGRTTAISAMEATVSRILGTPDEEQTVALTEEEEKQLEEIKKTYDTVGQAKIVKKLEAKKAKNEYTIDNMLIQYNPFGTNTQSAYVYFKTENPAKITYTVSVSDKEIKDFTREVSQEEEYQTEHEFQVIGLIPDMENKVKFTITEENGMVTTRSYAYNMGSLLGDEEVKLETDIDEKAEEELSDGLYVILGNDDSHLDFMYYYDNDGILRGEVPLLGYRSHRILFDESAMYYSISESKIAAVNRLGQVVSVYDLGDYSLHHDYVFDDDGNILILATDNKQDSVEDVVVKLDIRTGQVTEVLDLGDLLGNYKASCVANADGDLDWMHINTIQWMGSGQVLLSSRETSTILKVSNLYTAPQLDYMIGADKFWAGTGYENLLFTKDGSFTIQGGQHSVTYVKDDTLKEGQYYLYMFNNNIGYSETRPGFDWSSTGLTETSAKDGSTSYYYKYLVDENNRTFKLADSFKVPYSGYVSSVQEISGNVLADSGFAGEFREYNKEHKLIASYKMNAEKFIYRVYKYQF